MASSLVSLNYKSQAPLNLKCLTSLYNNHMSIGARIRQLRQHYGYSQEKFGELCGGVTKGMVSQWESDASVPPYERLREFKSKGHQFSFDWLLEGNMANPYEQSPEQQVYVAMQDMSKANKYAMVKIGHTLAEQDDDGNGGGSNDKGTKKTAAQ